MINTTPESLKARVEHEKSFLTLVPGIKIYSEWQIL